MLALALLASTACSGGQVGLAGDGTDGSGGECEELDDHLACTYKRVDGLALSADVYGAWESDAAPAIVWLHGGGLIFGHRAELADAQGQLEMYRERGYVVVAVDYRLAPATELADIQGDVADAYAWLREAGPELGVDPERIGVVGHSAGAYLSLSLGFTVEPRPSALVSFYGYGRLDWYATPAYTEEGTIDDDDPAIEAVRSAPPIANTSLDELDDRLTYYAYCRQRARWPVEVAGHDLDEQDFFTQYEPLEHVSDETPPTILLHGDMDDDVPFAEATAMKAALDDAGVDAELIHDPSFEHGFDEDMDAPAVRQAFERMLDFLDEHV